MVEVETLIELGRVTTSLPLAGTAVLRVALTLSVEAELIVVGVIPTLVLVRMAQSAVFMNIIAIINTKMHIHVIFGDFEHLKPSAFDV